MIVKLPSKIVPCLKCKNKGVIGRKTSALNTFYIVCGCMTKSGKREVITKKQFDKRILKLAGRRK